MPIAHVSLPVSSLQTSKSFYLQALKPLGYGIFMEIESTTVGMTIKYDGPDFWLHACPESQDEDEVGKVVGDEVRVKRDRMHVAFKGASREVVREFWKAGIKAGGKDNGPPGERAYTKGYYAAYILDLDGHNVECVYYQPLWLSAVQVAPKVAGAVVVAAAAWWVGRAGWGL